MLSLLRQQEHNYNNLLIIIQVAARRGALTASESPLRGVPPLHRNTRPRRGGPVRDGHVTWRGGRGATWAVASRGGGRGDAGDG